MSLFLLKKKHEHTVKSTDNGEVKESVTTIEVLGIPLYRSVTSHNKEKEKRTDACVNAFQKFKEKSYENYAQNQLAAK